MSGHHSLPLLDRRGDELSKCAFCPKLCRATCVVSEAEPREALTPWGKMTSAFDATRGAPLEPDRVELAWGCSNCFRCREACDHRNPVTPTLNDARADYVTKGHAPPRVSALLARTDSIDAELRQALKRLEGAVGVDASSPRALLLGCRYTRKFEAEARAAIRLVAGLVGPVRLVSGCCGAWQRAAGDAAAATANLAKVAAAVGPDRNLFVLDPRCTLELASLTPTSVVELAFRHLSRFAPTPRDFGQLRYHDSCALGRGLGRYDEPRELLARVTGRAPAELLNSRELSRCSAGGGILPVSMPEIAAAGALRLAEEHRRAGGGTLVTSCASSLSQLRRAGVPAVDLTAVLESGLRSG